MTILRVWSYHEQAQRVFWTSLRTTDLSRLVKGRAGGAVTAAARAEDGSILDFRISIQT